MAELARMSQQAAGAMTVLLQRLRALALIVALFAGFIGLLTYATGWWAFDGATGWAIVGAVVCFAPVVTALISAGFVHGATLAAPHLLNDVTAFLSTRRGGDDVSSTLIDLDSGIALTTSARSFSGVRAELGARKRELPALWLGVRAITLVPKLAVFTVLGIVGVGFLGTILLLVAIVS